MRRDGGILPKGKVLPEQWVVFVMESDPFKLGRPLYLFEQRDMWGTSLGDRAHRLYANGAWRGDDEVGLLMADFCEADPDKIRNRLLADWVEYYKRDPEGVREMCEVFDEIRADGREEGLEEGRKEGREETLIEGVRSLVSNLKMSADQAFDALGVPQTERARFQALL